MTRQSVISKQDFCPRKTAATPANHKLPVLMRPRCSLVLFRLGEVLNPKPLLTHFKLQTPKPYTQSPTAFLSTLYYTTLQETEYSPPQRLVKGSVTTTRARMPSATSKLAASTPHIALKSSELTRALEAAHS